MKRQSHIEKLIQEMCPNGVKYMPLGEIATRNKGMNITAGQMKKIANPKGNVRIFAAGNTKVDVNDCDIPQANVIRENGIIVKSRGHVSFEYYTKPFTHKNEMWSYSNFINANIKYVYYYLEQNTDHFKKTAKANSVKLPQLCVNDTDSYKIPLPPLAIQEEIVRILDAFANLIENIDTEIKEREKQLDCALNANYNSDFAKVQISTLGTITRGRRFVRTDIVEQGTPCIHYGDIYTRYPICVNRALTYLMGDITKKMRYAKNGDVIYVGAGENDEDIGMAIAWLGNEPAAVHDACYILSNHQQDTKYLAYMSRANKFHQQLKMSVASGKICSIPPDGLGRVKIPLPPLAEQRAIAEKLDTIEAFIANLKEERALRQQQYEYYREYLINLLK